MLIVAFIAGAIAGVIGMTLAGMRITNMSYSEMSDAGVMMIEAGNNRESTLALHKNGELIDEIVLKER